MFVVMRTIFEAEVADEVLDLSARSAQIFSAHRGLISMRRLHSVEQRCIYTILEWESPAAHAACQEDAAWGPLYPRWQALQAEGKLSFTMETCRPL